MGHPEFIRDPWLWLLDHIVFEIGRSFFLWAGGGAILLAAFAWFLQKLRAGVDYVVITGLFVFGALLMYISGREGVSYTTITATFVLGAIFIYASGRLMMRAGGEGRNKQSKEEVNIFPPLGGYEVDFKQDIYGWIYPADTALRVLVLAGDGKMYWQGEEGKVNVKGSIWSVRCQFGDNLEQSKGRMYEIIAVVPVEAIKVSPIPGIPSDVRAEKRIKVRRKE